MGNIIASFTFSSDIETVKIIVGRETKEILYDSSGIEYEEIINKIMNKSHLVFIIDYDHFGRNKKYTIYVEEKINCYDNYISHLNTNSFIIDEDNKKYKNEGILIRSRENDIFLEVNTELICSICV